jgi:hypothetical protein
VHLLTCTSHFSGLRSRSSDGRCRLSSIGSGGVGAGSGAAQATDQARLRCIDGCTDIRSDTCTVEWGGMGACTPGVRAGQGGCVDHCDECRLELRALHCMRGPAALEARVLRKRRRLAWRLRYLTSDGRFYT